jgi:GGDEF domain-containing protein
MARPYRHGGPNRQYRGDVAQWPRARHPSRTDPRRRLGCYLDITERRRAEAHVRHMAHHDTLTGLANRAVHRAPGRRLARLGRKRLGSPPIPSATNRLVAVMLLDLHHFKDVNDTLGHAAGDALLRLVAERITGCLRPEIRWPAWVATSSQCCWANASQPASRRRRSHNGSSMPYRRPMRWTHTRRKWASALASLYVHDDKGNTDPAELLHQADTALYQARQQAGAPTASLKPGCTLRCTGARQWSATPPGAVGRWASACPAYQTRLRADRRCRGARAVAAEHGMVTPAEFILAEGAGLIGDLGA